MPIPFIIAGLGIAAATATLGVGGHLDAKDKREETKKLIDEFNKECADTQKKFEFYKKEYMNSLEKLGETEKRILETSLKEFFETYQKIREKVTIESSTDLAEIDGLSDMEFKELETIFCYVEGNIKMLTGSALAYLALGNLFSAGGVELLASGGLSAIVTTSTLFSPLSFLAGPAVIFVGGLYASIKADEKLEEVKKEIEEKRVQLEEMKVWNVKYKAIAEHTKVLENVVQELDKYLRILLNPLKEISLRVEVKKDRVPLKEYLSKEEIKILGKASSVARAMTTIMKTPMTDKMGNITYASKECLKKSKNI